MADSFLAYQNPGVTDKKLDSETLTVGANTVERERVQISGAGATDLVLPVAHDAVDAGNPIKIGGKASSAAPADVSLTGDRVDAYFDMKGRQAVFTDVALPAGTNAIGKLAANSGVVIGDVNVVNANVSANVAQMNGVVVTMGAGVSGTGVQRVVLATDQPQLTNKLLVTPDSVALPANQSVNISQINAVAPLMGNGISGTGAQRVTIASDSTGQVALAAGSATIGALTANQSVNVAQMNGVATTMGSGVIGTGVQRVVLATDQPVIPVSDNAGSLTVDQAATVSSISAKLATDSIMNDVTALTPKFAIIAVSASGDNTIVSLVSSKKLRVLSYTLVANAAVNAKWRSSTTSDKTGLLYLSANGGVHAAFCPVGHFETVAGEALTLNLSGAIAVGGHLTYIEV